MFLMSATACRHFGTYYMTLMLLPFSEFGLDYLVITGGTDLKQTILECQNLNVGRFIYLGLSTHDLLRLS